MSYSHNTVIACAEVEPATNADVAGAEVRVSPKPHMTPAVVEFLQDRMRTSKCYLEYGAGGSTRMAVRMNVPFVFSVESDLNFGRAVRRIVSRDIKDTKFKMVTANLGPTNRWGYPSDTESFRDWAKYPTEVWKAIRAAWVKPDLILVDGRFRVACFLTSLLQSDPGTRILFDDYVGREDRYGVIEKHAARSTLIDRAAIFDVPHDLDVRTVAMDLALYYADPR